MRNDRRFQRTKAISTDRLVRLAHTVKTFDGSTYVNCLDGNFIEINTLEKVQIESLIPQIRTVLNTNQEIVAKRKNLGDILFSGHLVSKSKVAS